MIVSFRCEETEKIFDGEVSKKLPYDIQETARRKLRYIHRATVIRELSVPPGNHLEKLTGGREGQWSIRVNEQWRVCFRWEDANAHDVEVVDYH